VLTELAIPEECSVAKILVADDNSNIQKMVGLALKDQGIDVVAVGNGEAAVRKISDVRPDLVLADVFMPVRNGYEVCKYVKDDSALAHIPVILLVGAFDPLDEQEAQRVGADGVLKKPFVPPDPLISMVKSALTRSGVAYSGAPAEKPESAPVSAVEMIAPRQAAPVAEAANAEEIPEPVMKKAEPLHIDSGAPLAFGSLLETPPTEEEEDLGYAAPVQPATERDWGASDAEDEEEENEEDERPQPSWRAASDTFGDEKDEAAAGVRDWRETAFDETAIAPRKSSNGGWEPSQEKTPLTEAAEDVVAPAQEVRPLGNPISISEGRGPIPVSPFAQENSPVVTAQNGSRLTAAVEEPSIAAQPSETQSAPGGPSLAAAVVGEETAPPALAAAPPAVERTPAAAQQAVKPVATNSWFTTAPSPWDTEVQKASQLASTWDAPKAAAAPSPVPADSAEATAAKPAHAVEAENETAGAPSVYAQDNELAETVMAKAEEAGLTAHAVEAIREEVAEVTENANQAAAPAVTEPGKGIEQAPAASTDELVAKVLAKMSPEVLQAVTREILKPVVEAIVRDELSSKKP